MTGILCICVAVVSLLYTAHSYADMTKMYEKHIETLEKELDRSKEVVKTINSIVKSFETMFKDGAM